MLQIKFLSTTCEIAPRGWTRIPVCFLIDRRSHQSKIVKSRLNYLTFAQILPRKIWYGSHSLSMESISSQLKCHNDVIKWTDFTRWWSFVKGIHRSPVDPPHIEASDAGLWCFLWSAPELTVELWANNRNARDFIRHRAHYDVTARLIHARCVVNKGFDDSWSDPRWLSMNRSWPTSFHSRQPCMIVITCIWKISEVHFIHRAYQRIRQW